MENEMAIPWRIRSRCDAALDEYQRHLCDIVRSCSQEELNGIAPVVSGDVDRLFELHDVAVRIAALHVRHGC